MVRARTSPENGGGPGETIPGSELIRFTADIGSDPGWIRRLAMTDSLTVRMRACQPILPGGRRSIHLLELSGPSDVLERVLRSLAQDPEVVRVASSSTTASGDRVVQVEAATQSRCRILFTAGLLCRSCRFLESPRSSSVPWVLVGPRQAVSAEEQRARRRLLTQGAHLQSLRPYSPPQGLTLRQRTALESARRLGYFEVPRRAGLAAIARDLGISRSSAAELLHRGIARMLADGLDDGPRLRR